MGTLFDNTAKKLDNERIYTVTELTNQVSAAIYNRFNSTIRVSGEVSDIKTSAKGHTYFRLKEQASILNAFYYKWTKLSFEIE